ncbi:fluoride efflux transporter CrcB [Rhizobium leguminosarum]|uniref:Fluoride-specific ion channel FluC n=2 Tax=Rhizobium TaxID=379 RepID=FLUC_RHIJ3|nr:MULTISPECIES: fluoride efflux transporter CrcB [Rhizobium]Q1MG67.1 RecName: Full=Fluoride-specific ion channel FluC [Rhizobium johnstonii 3841]MBY5318769.1 fluoride efflux transporter CrcB [Rhizobium leguminosarum]MBY5371939.1 fluoride efflux transporter CrcB [Rhizobium leguminosarum]MBY5383278.1 fluoride efflux transporter CrcB [Rhizobium leguminosarum]MBY5422661.1 fluoride efflux transporter CrcB [Rhizobium leguminosarum]MCA2429932.1 fluoride efflux transporter CrcB [Rhizobium leguminosa
MIQAILVAFGGAIGSVLRYYVGQWALRLMGSAFPWGTLAVNVVGCFVIGVFAELIARKFDASVELRLLLITGFLGGFTTFSAFSLDAISLFERGEAVAGGIYIAASVGLSMAAVIAGLAVMRALA